MSSTQGALPSLQPGSPLERTPRSRLCLAACAGVAVLLSGCQSLKAVSQCNRLLTSVNASLVQASELHGRPPSSETYKELAELFGRVESQLVEQSKNTGEVEQGAKGLAKHMRKVSREARNYSQTLERLDKATQAADENEQKHLREELARIRLRAEKLVESTKNESRKFRETCRPKG